MKEVKRFISTGFWNDDKILNDFSPEDKYFMLYLLSNPYTTQLGVYHLPLKKASLELGYNLETVKTLLDRFESKYKIIRFNPETSEVAIKNYLIHSIVRGGKPVADCLEKDLKGVKDISLVGYVINHLSSSNNKYINDTVIDFIKKHKELVINNNSYIHNDNDNERYVDDTYHESSKNAENQQEETIPISEVRKVIQYLNQILGTKYTDKNKSTCEKIRARFAEGHTLEDFMTVIDKKYEQWGRDPKMSKFLRPETLFCASHFESYLNEIGAKPQSLAEKWGLM